MGGFSGVQLFGAVLGAAVLGAAAGSVVAPTSEVYRDGYADGYAWGRYTAREGGDLDRPLLWRSANRGGSMSWTARDLLGER